MYRVNIKAAFVNPLQKFLRKTWKHTVTHTPFLTAIFQVNLSKPVAALILNLHLSFSWMSSWEAKTLHTFLFEVGTWCCPYPQGTSSCTALTVSSKGFWCRHFYRLAALPAAQPTAIAVKHKKRKNLGKLNLTLVTFLRIFVSWAHSIFVKCCFLKSHIYVK